MDVRIELYNTDGGTAKDSQSVIFFYIYLCFLALWVFVCFKNQRYVHKIHILMGAFLVMVMVDLICGPADKQYVKITRNAHGWDVLIYTFKFFRLVLFYTVIVLTGSGWSFLRPYLPIKETMISLIVILLNIAIEVIRETNPFCKEWLTWNYIDILLVEIFICWVSLSIPNLRTVISWLNNLALKAEGKTARNFAKDKLWVHFIAVAVYPFFWRWAVFDCHYKWMSKAACNARKEICSLVFCMVMFYTFRPVNKYVIFDVEIIEVGQHAEGEKSQTDPVSGQKTKNRRKRCKKNTGQVSFYYPKLPEDYEW